MRDPARARERARNALQLQIYALAWEAEHGSRPDAVELHFLEGDVVGRVTPTDAQLERAEPRSRPPRTGISAGAFEATPGFPPATGARSGASARPRREAAGLHSGRCRPAIAPSPSPWAGARSSPGPFVAVIFMTVSPVGDAGAQLLGAVGLGAAVGLTALAAALVRAPGRARARLTTAGRRGGLAGLVTSILVVLRALDVVSLPVVLFLVIGAVLVEVAFSLRR